MSDLRKVVLKKDYAVRHDILIETGSVIHIGEYKAMQLGKAGFIEFEGNKDEIEKEHKRKSQRQKKEQAPTIVEHKITE